MQIMMVYVIESGPYPSPGGRSKWLDLSPDPLEPARPSVSGWYNGELKVSPCPVCKGGLKHSWLERNCGMTGNDLSVTLVDFRALKGKGEAIRIARQLLSMNMEPSGFATYHGDFGTGKSHLLKGIVNGFRNIGVQSRYATLPDLLADIRDRFSDANGSVSVELAIEQYRKVPVLCIDEVDTGRVNITGWAKETIFRLLDARYNDRESVLTILASNVNPDRMSPEFGYLRSRMDGGLVIEVGGDDMRPLIARSGVKVPEMAKL